MNRPQQESDIKLDNLTREDLKKIQKSMKRPEFMGLLNEYMVEISDPKNKNEYDEYLRQLQREKELPKHMKIVEIRPKFCFRTFIVSQKNKKHEMKFFVNMCETEYLEKPSCEPGPGQDGKVGYNWKIPNSMGKIRYDQDKKGDPCQVVDIAFHPDTFMFAFKKEFQEMMINIALEAAERQLGERKETLSRDYVILKNVICKGADGKPALMPIRYIEGKMYNKGEGPNNEFERDMEGRQTKLQKEINKQKEEYDKEKSKKKQSTKQEEQPKQEQLEQGPKLVVDLERGVQQPKYSTIYTYPVDYSEFIDSPYTNKKKIPSAFNIEFAIPRVESVEEVAGQQLEINDKKIVLKIGQKYFIDLELQDLKIKYVLLTANAKAKYDKKKKALRIVIPVDQSISYQTDTQAKPEDAQNSLVEDETWKNKVLQFTEPNISVKMLEQTDKEDEEKPKLVEEIDDEDIVDKPEPQQSANSVSQEDEIQEEGERRADKKFSLSSYYNKQGQVYKASLTNRIGFLFQQTVDKVVLVLQMKNYQKEQIKYLNILNRQFLIVWNQSSKGEVDCNRMKYEHCRLADKYVGDVERIDFVLRVGFLAIMVLKKAQAKGKYWQKEAVESIVYPFQTEEEQLNAFNQYYQQQQQIIAQQRRISQESNRVVPRQEDAIGDNQKIKEENKGIDVTAQPVLESDKAAIREEVARGSLVQERLAGSLGPQFIEFQAGFIGILE